VNQSFHFMLGATAALILICAILLFIVSDRNSRK
jgi:hypothetical protein